MIIYIEQEILLDTQCRDLYICDNELNDEYLINSSYDQCSCKKRSIILCKYNHDQCEKRCLLENNLFFKQKSTQSNEILFNNHSINVVILEKNELKTNAEILYICQKDNLPKSIFEHLKNQLTFTEIPLINHQVYKNQVSFFQKLFLFSLDINWKFSIET